MEICAIADAGGNGDDGLGNEAGDDAGQRAFHAGNDDDDICALDNFEFAENTVQAGDADVTDALDTVAHDFGGHGGFLGDGQIAGAGADNGNRAGTFARGRFFDGDAARQLVVNGVLEFFAQGAGVGVGDARDENALLAG